jgi:glycosyltransferase involved in cell wall biosynthesis
MAERGIEILKDKEKWRAMSAAARTAAERYSQDAVVPMYEQHYEKVLRTVHDR